MDNKSVSDILSRLKQGDESALEELPQEERKVIQTILGEVSKRGASRTLEALWSLDYDRRPVSIDEFLDNDFYLGKVGRSIFPGWRNELRKTFDPQKHTSEWIMRGSIGSGKTSIAVISLLYKIHQLILLKNPQRYYGLIDKSPIVFGLFNIWKYLAKSTAYQYIREWTQLSRFFMEFQDKGDAEFLKTGYIKFPKSITIALGASAIHALGQNIFGGLLDEADLGRDKSVSDEEVSQVADSYGQVRARMDSRFLQKGGSNPGILLLVSQVRGKDSFLEKHVVKMQSDPNTRITSFSLWEIKSHLFGRERFKVVVGDQRSKSYIIDESVTDKVREGLQIINVPEELRSRFEYDLDAAIRDLAGVPTYGSNLFLTRRDKLFECYDLATPRSHPFTTDTVLLSIESKDETSIVDSFRKELCMRQFDKSTGAWTPKWYPGVDRAIHVDLSKNKDATGIAMGCIGDIKEVIRYDQDERPYRTRDYSIFIDFVLQIKAVRGSEIDFSKIRNFIFYLHALGFPVKFVSYDGWQSIDSLQQSKKAGYDVKQISVDRKPDRYNYLKNTIYENRLDIYEYTIFTDEITKLQDHSLEPRIKPSIDHPMDGSKDTSDAVTGVASRLLEEKGLLHGVQPNTILDQKIESRFKDEAYDARIERQFTSTQWLTGDKHKDTNPNAYFDDIFNDKD